MEQEQHKKDENKECKKRVLPYLLTAWVLLPLSAALYNKDIFWFSFFSMAIALAPAFLTYSLGFWIAKKGKQFFLTFRKKPLLWCGLGLMYFSGGLLLSNSVLFLIYWFVMWIPLWQDFSAAFYEDCKTRWQVFSFILLTLFRIIFANVRGISFSITLLWLISLKAIYDKLFD